MARFILIDRHSGYIFGDTADFANGKSFAAPIDAARELDISIGERGRTYSETNRHDAAASYDVYRADIKGSEAVPVVQDGQDQEMIDVVMRDCAYVTTIRIETTERS